MSKILSHSRFRRIDAEPAVCIGDGFEKQAYVP
jgi:hypothetical protein